MELIFRQAQTGDVAAITELFRHAVRAVDPGDYTEDQRRAWADGADDPGRWLARIREHYFLVVEQGGRMCGFASLTTDGYIDLLYVHPNFQRRGIARALLRRLVRKAEMDGCRQVCTDASSTARPTFEHSGFAVLRKNELLVRGVDMHNFHMAKDLPEIILETDRLRLRRFLPGDGAAMFELNSDPEVLRYTGDPPFADPPEAEAFVRSYDHYEHFGIGRWVVVEKATGTFLGWCGLKYSLELDETDLGFRFFRRYWNKGYATESARACVDYAFEKLGLSLLVGRAMHANGASIRVLEKVGFHYWKDFDFDGHRGVYYLLKNKSGSD